MLAIAGIALFLPTIAQAATLVGFSSYQDGIVTIDSDTGVVTTIGGDYTGFYTDSVSGLAYDSSGVLWGYAGSAYANGTIGTVNPTTGNFTSIATDSYGRISGMDFAPDGTLYGRYGGSPHDYAATISTTTALPTLLASSGVATLAGFAVSSDGKYGYSVDVRSDTLMQYDIINNVFSQIGLTASDLVALTFVGDSLFGVTNNAADALVKLDTLTGSVLSSVALSTGAFSNITALTTMPGGPPISAVPIPAGGVLLLSALGGLLAIRRRKAT